MSPENMSGRFSGGKYGILFEANTLNIWNFTDLNSLKREGILKEEGKERTKLFEKGEVYCGGEVDYWKASGWGSLIRDRQESKSGNGAAVRHEDKEVGVHGDRQAEKQGAPPGVPEEYDRSGEPRRLSLVASMLKKVEEPEVEEFGHILEYPMIR